MKCFLAACALLQAGLVWADTVETVERCIGKNDQGTYCRGFRDGKIYAEYLQKAEGTPVLADPGTVLMGHDLATAILLKTLEGSQFNPGTILAPSGEGSMIIQSSPPGPNLDLLQ